MKKDDNTTNYSARLVCEKCGYVFGLKEVAYIEHGDEPIPFADPKILTHCYNEIYPKYCPKCKREAQQISYDTRLTKALIFDIPNGKCKDTPVCWDCEVAKKYCPVDSCPHKDSVSPKYFEKHGLYPCAVFMTLKNANDFAEYLLKRLDLCCEPISRISLQYVLTAINFYNGYARLHKSAENYSVKMPTTNEGRCGWTKEELQTYGIAIDFEENALTGRTYCIYLPVPKYFGDKKEAK